MSTTAIALAQDPVFTRQDTLRGTITAERSWWDLTHYHLDVKANPQDSSIIGTNTVHYKVLKTHQKMQIDLQTPMKINKVFQDGKALFFTRDGNVYYITLEKEQQIGENNEVIVHFSGSPKISRQPPWDGGLTWTKDTNGKEFIATTCQGDGASLWWPCKDHMYDEPDSMHITATVPDHLVAVSNGRLLSTKQNEDQTKTYSWFVSNPISNYVINLNIGDYVQFSEVYEGEKGPLDCSYYVLRDNLEKAKVHFKEVGRMLQAFEHWFGPYPFYEDSYKLVEVPYPGMEHQSSVTYGNGYQNGYSRSSGVARDLSGTGWGMKFDFIIIHESGHEWFANNITYKDIADMWIHESFTNYSENLFLNYHFGKNASSEYVIGTRELIQNDRPIIGKYNVNYSGSGDMYYKGGNMLHTLRQLINDDEKWRSILREMNKDFYHQTVTTEQIENYLSEHIGMDLSKFFDQYLRDTRIPHFEYSIKENTLRHRWSNCVAGFAMPMNLYLGDNTQLLYPTEEWQEIEINLERTTLTPDPNYYVETIKYPSN
jgi:aminopeptidase N